VGDVDVVQDLLRVSAAAPDGEMCFLPAGDMSPEQTQRCAD
jgi:hypothetical protein